MKKAYYNRRWYVRCIDTGFAIVFMGAAALFIPRIVGLFILAVGTVVALVGNIVCLINAWKKKQSVEAKRMLWPRNSAFKHAETGSVENIRKLLRYRGAVSLQQLREIMSAEHEEIDSALQDLLSKRDVERITPVGTRSDDKIFYRLLKH